MERLDNDLELNLRRLENGEALENVVASLSPDQAELIPLAAHRRAGERGATP